VVKASDWIDFRQYSKLENRAGVYLFVDGSLSVKYVGKAGAGRMADEVYNAIYRGKDAMASMIKALYTNSDDNAWSLETDLRNKYNPPNNRT
jgi:excinuclease UvrABC nuclease subunit